MAQRRGRRVWEFPAKGRGAQDEWGAQSTGQRRIRSGAIALCPRQPGKVRAGRVTGRSVG